MRSRILYLQEADANTAFFHQQARFRKKKNFIPKLQVGDQVVVSQEQKQATVFDCYENILGRVDE
jgi:predicted glycosyltransferase